MQSYSTINRLILTITTIIILITVQLYNTNTVTTVSASTATKYRGVNLGGWLLLETFLTPEIFDINGKIIHDEYTLCKELGTTEANNRLINHWNTFYTKKDIEKFVEQGFNSVRIPIGYWIIKPEYPYVSGGLFYLRRMIQWCDELGVSVMIDLHGAPGHQNPFDNSGRGGYSQWAYNNRTKNVNSYSPPHNLAEYPYIHETLEILKLIAIEFHSTAPNVYALELVNEIAYTGLELVRQFYYAAYDLLRPLAPNWMIVMGDNFQSAAWSNFMTDRTKYYNIAMDVHIYDIWSETANRYTYNDHLASAANKVWIINALKSSNMPIFIGEWSLANTDCQPYLQGIPIPGEPPRSIYEAKVGPCDLQAADTTGTNVTNFSAAYKKFLADYAKVQLSVWESQIGNYYWTGKTTSIAPQWNSDYMIELLGGSICPKDKNGQFTDCELKSNTTTAPTPAPTTPIPTVKPTPVPTPAPTTAVPTPEPTLEPTDPPSLYPSLLIDDFNNANRYYIHRNLLQGYTNDDHTMANIKVLPDGKLSFTTKLDSTSYWYTVLAPNNQCFNSIEYNYLSIAIIAPVNSKFNIRLESIINDCSGKIHLDSILNTKNYMEFNNTMQILNIPLSEFQPINLSQLLSIVLYNFEPAIVEIQLDSIRLGYNPEFDSNSNTDSSSTGSIEPATPIPTDEPVTTVIPTETNNPSTTINPTNEPSTVLTPSPSPSPSSTTIDDSTPIPPTGTIRPINIDSHQDPNNNNSGGIFSSASISIYNNNNFLLLLFNYFFPAILILVGIQFNCIIV